MCKLRVYFCEWKLLCMEIAFVFLRVWKLLLYFWKFLRVECGNCFWIFVCVNCLVIFALLCVEIKLLLWKLRVYFCVWKLCVCGNYFWIFVCGNCFCIFTCVNCCVCKLLLYFCVWKLNCCVWKLRVCFCVCKLLCVEIAFRFLRV